MRSALLCWGIWSCEVLSVLLRALQADEGFEKVGPKAAARVQKRQDLLSDPEN
jgi:hypothetical protein